MAEDTGIGVVGLQGAQQGRQRGLLGPGTGVGRAIVGIETALIADTDTVGVVLPGMGTGHLLGTAYMQLAVAGDIVVVAAGGEAPGPVTGLEGLEGETLVAACGRAVDDDQMDRSHGLEHRMWHSDRLFLKNVLLASGGDAALDSDGSKNTCNNGCNEFQHFYNFTPI